MSRNIRVSLKVDLTKYGKGLVPGTEGYTIEPCGIWSRNNDNFVSVCFPGVKTLDVLWTSLEIIDDQYLEEISTLKKEQVEELKSATNIIKYVGPRGGFRHLRYNYTTKDGCKCSTSIGFKKDAEEKIKIFERLGISVKTIVID